LRRRALPRLRRREDEAARSDRIRSLGRGLLTPPTWDGEPVPTRTVDHLAARTERSRPAPASAVTRQGRVPGLIVASARPRSWPATAPGPGRRRPHGRRTCSNRAANEWTLGQRTITYPSPVASDSTEDNLDNPTAGRESTNPAGGRNHCPRQGKRVMSLLRGFCASQDRDTAQMPSGIQPTPTVGFHEPWCRERPPETRVGRQHDPHRWRGAGRTVCIPKPRSA
jgi:hypothetical protein